ncbi:MAG: glyoxalase [Blastomonas sp. CACIA14H2]|uniref:YybH family protein n=1 Tax=Blastomonas sp. CACIA14H2 TaxID=1419876 RepID=UPI0003CF9FBA|nr:MAG: glyoxalase [Blastomonas sp. CACIA14H2]
MTAEDEIRRMLDHRRAAISAKAADASIEHYAQDVILFDLAPPLAQSSSDAKDPAQAQQWFDTWDGAIATEITDLVVKAEGDTAFAFGLLHMSGNRTDSSQSEFWFRTTVCLERRNGQWRIVHEHNSFPMLMDGSGKAATDLQPDTPID